MKKLIVAFLALLLLFTLGCIGGKEKTSPTINNTITQKSVNKSVNITSSDLPDSNDLINPDISEDLPSPEAY